MKKRAKNDEILKLRLPSSEKKRIQQLAALEHKTVSALIRQLIQERGDMTWNR